MVEEQPELQDKEIELNMNFGNSYNERWVFYFASNSSKDPLTINPPEKAYGNGRLLARSA